MTLRVYIQSILYRCMKVGATRPNGGAEAVIAHAPQLSFYQKLVFVDFRLVFDVLLLLSAGSGSSVGRRRRNNRGRLQDPRWTLQAVMPEMHQTSREQGSCSSCFTACAR